MTDHGPAAAERHGRSLACSSYHASSGRWSETGTLGIAPIVARQAWHHRRGALAAYRGAMTTLTRGPLPSRVYWARRLLLLSVVVGLVLTGVGVAKLAGGEPKEPEQARLAGSATGTSAAETEPGEDAEPTQDVKGTKGSGETEGKTEGKNRKDKGPVLASPHGPCVDRDIAVTPTAKKTVAG